MADRLQPFGRSNSLSAKLIQLTGTGVPDVYQGTEIWDLSLVDPDNRRPVDYRRRVELLAQIDGGDSPTWRSRRGRGQAAGDQLGRCGCAGIGPELFTGIPTAHRTGPGRRAPVCLRSGRGTDPGDQAAGGTGSSRGMARRPTVECPAGNWTDDLTGHQFTGRDAGSASVLATYPVALLVRDA